MSKATQSLTPVAAVVKNDTSPTTLATAVDTLLSLETRRQDWERVELAGSNKRLYAILSDAYAFYRTLKEHGVKAVRQACLSALNDFIALRGYTFLSSTHDMTRVVKCVFGVDRRRVSAYSIALREALRQNVAAADLAEFLEVNGGVEQIRMGGTKPLSASRRADMVKDEVVNADLGLIKIDPCYGVGNADWTDKQVVIVATYLPTGQFQANAVIRHDAAVNAALAAYYSQQRALVIAAQKAEREAEKAYRKAQEAVEKAAIKDWEASKAANNKEAAQQAAVMGNAVAERLAA